jgi:hypothetical protein
VDCFTIGGYRYSKIADAVAEVRRRLAASRTGVGSLHDWLGSHVADLKASFRDKGEFVSATVRGCAMVKPSGHPWHFQRTA